MMQFFSGLFSQNEEPFLDDQNKKDLSQDIINQLKYYIAIIEIKNKFTSCFFLDSNLNNNSNSSVYFLCTTSNFITEKNVENKDTFNIHLGDNYLDTISIKLDIKQRKIKRFKEIKEFILIQIFPEMDKIPKDKILSIKNGNLKEYLGENSKEVYLIGYQNFYTKEISVFNCEIIEIFDKYKIKFNRDENSFLGCSPICIINRNELQLKNRYKVIGIKGQYDILSDNFGFLLGPIIYNLTDYQKAPNQLFNNIMNNIIQNDNQYNINNEIQIKEDYKNEELGNTIEGDINNVDTDINTDEMKKLQLYYFYTFEEYKTIVIKFHNLISKYYVSQTTKNFFEQYSALEKYLLNHPVFVNTHRKFIESLQFFKDPKNFGNKLPDELIDNFNKILSSTNLELIEKFSYFIAGFMLSLITYGIKEKCLFSNNGHRLYKRVNLNFEDIKRFESNKNKIIMFKTFLNEITTLEHLQGLAYKAKIDSTFVKVNNKFDTEINIRHVFNESLWEATGISLSKFFFPEKVFNLFSFFKVVDVDINYGNKSAIITLENVGIKYNLEEKIARFNNRFKVEYNRRENIIEVV